MSRLPRPAQRTPTAGHDFRLWSGNPKGRPRGAKSRLDGSGPARLQAALPAGQSPEHMRLDCLTLDDVGLNPARPCGGAPRSGRDHPGRGSRPRHRPCPRYRRMIRIEDLSHIEGAPVTTPERGSGRILLNGEIRSLPPAVHARPRNSGASCVRTTRPPHPPSPGATRPICGHGPLPHRAGTSRQEAEANTFTIDLLAPPAKTGRSAPALRICPRRLPCPTRSRSVARPRAGATSSITRSRWPSFSASTVAFATASSRASSQSSRSAWAALPEHRLPCSAPSDTLFGSAQSPGQREQGIRPQATDVTAFSKDRTRQIAAQSPIYPVLSLLRQGNACRRPVRRDCPHHRPPRHPASAESKRPSPAPANCCGSMAGEAPARRVVQKKARKRVSTSAGASSAR